METTSNEKPKLVDHKASLVKSENAQIVKLLQVIIVFVFMYTLYFTQTLIIPLVFSALIALLLSPLVKRLKRWHVPRSLSSMILLVALVAPFSLLTAELAEPLEKWMKILPKLSLQITEEITEFSDKFDIEKQARLQKKEESSSSGFFSWFSSEEEPSPKENQNVVGEKIKQNSLDAILSILTAAPIFMAQLFGSLMLILFLLIFGPSLFSVFVNDFPIVTDKKRANALVKRIQQALSDYIITISLINSGLGLITAVAFAFFGIEDAILWGVIVALFNFVPYIGSVISLSILLIVGGVQFGITLAALLPCGLFFIINLTESQLVTPAILGRSMQVNPLIIILWLLITGWMWGILGVLLAVPLLVCIKLTLQQMQVFPHWLKLIEANDSKT